MNLTLLLILAVIVIGFILTYNTVISKKNNVDNAVGSIDAELKKRRDLIPNLVESVKAYMQYEKDLLEKITRLRESAEKIEDPEKRLQIEQELSKALQSLKVRFENYPNLKANKNFLQLQATLTDVEESIAAARRFYNQAVTEYNNILEQIPFTFIAKMFGLQRKEVFTIPEEERASIDIGELFKK
jgi:LemA protein